MQCEKQDKESQCPQLDCPKSEHIEIHDQCCPVCVSKRSFCVFVCLSVYLSVCQTVFLYFCLSVQLLICLFICTLKFYFLLYFILSYIILSRLILPLPPQNDGSVKPIHQECPAVPEDCDLLNSYYDEKGCPACYCEYSS